MNKTFGSLFSSIISIIFILFSMQIFAQNELSGATPETIKIDKNSHLLPGQFSVFTDGIHFINHFAPAFEEKIITVDNTYNENPGCYIICYSHNPRGAAFFIGADIYAMGMIRVPGRYQEKDKKDVCVPDGSDSIDISINQQYKNSCNLRFRNCQFNPGGCWAGGDTGDWM